MRSAVACAIGFMVVSVVPAPARDTLPWTDANPLKRESSPRAHRRFEAPKKPIAAAATVPAQAKDVPVPEQRPATKDGPPADPAPATAGERAAEPVPEPPSATDAGAPANADAAAPAAGAATGPERPVTAIPAAELPVPDARPQPSPAESAPEAPVPEAAPPSPAPVPSKGVSPAPAATPPVEPEDAPNSTEKLKARGVEVTPAASVAAAAAVEDAVACEAELKKRGVDFTVEETISEGECGVLRPLAIRRLASGVEVSPKTQLLCRTVLALDDWMTASVVPAAKSTFADDRLREFRHASTYVCRPRASETGISEHARGSAVDIGSFVLSSGREVGIAAKDAGSPEAAFLDAVRNGACGPFKTVLGPGSNADHATHFHLDIAARNNGATYCK